MTLYDAGMDLEHPDITSALLTGYPTWEQWRAKEPEPEDDRDHETI